jgi:hypothetical protein
LQDEVVRYDIRARLLAMVKAEGWGDGVAVVDNNRKTISREWSNYQRGQDEALP